MNCVFSIAQLLLHCPYINVGFFVNAMLLYELLHSDFIHCTCLHILDIHCCCLMILIVVILSICISLIIYWHWCGLSIMIACYHLCSLLSFHCFFLIYHFHFHIWSIAITMSCIRLLWLPSFAPNGNDPHLLTSAVATRCYWNHVYSWFHLLDFFCSCIILLILFIFSSICFCLVILIVSHCCYCFIHLLVL